MEVVMDEKGGKEMEGGEDVDGDIDGAEDPALGRGAGEEDEDAKQTESVFFNEAVLEAKRKRESALEEIERQREARGLIVPTDDREVRRALRAKGEPTCLFGEDAHDRRSRLRNLMLEDRSMPAEKAVVEDAKAPPPEQEQEKEKEPEEFFTEGSDALKQARRKLFVPSLQHAQERLTLAKKRMRGTEFREEATELYTALQNIAPVASQLGDTRPLSACAFSKVKTQSTKADAMDLSSTAASFPAMVATASWSGLVKLWSLPECGLLTTLQGHSERVSSVTFHPIEGMVLASGAADRTARVWRVQDLKAAAAEQTSLVFQGHVDRVTGVSFHPHGGLLASASYDSTWRLWDVSTASELLLQEGHARPVYRVAFHPDGSLAASAGLDRTTRIWDLRTGRCIMTFGGHVDSVYGLDFSPDGFHLATGSADNTIKIWDLRRRRCHYTIAAHSSCITSVRYQPDKGHALLSSSFDRTAKVWSRRGYVQVGTLTSHEDKVTCADISDDGELIVTSCYDKTWKLWSAKQSI